VTFWPNAKPSNKAGKFFFKFVLIYWLLNSVIIKLLMFTSAGLLGTLPANN